ncbi:MAG: biotin--[acetyl-CoA-carboxylase] ligase [Anaerolineae bacterium]|nr:biotin--[acetyl-CoA-carboxylase] ligase [Anaerolineae bacterium]
MTELFTAHTLAARLSPRAVRYLPQTGSTNDDARAWLRARPPAGSVVIADEQTGGRGRLGRAWRTPAGAALAVSIILRPGVESLHQVGMIGALAVVSAARRAGLEDVGIKWPNDVLVNGRKAAGVLPEAEWNGDHPLGVVLGIGVNIRVDFSGTELESTAISLETAAGHSLNRLDILADLLQAVDDWSARVDVFDAWKSRLRTLGQTVTVTNLRGVAEAVDEQGALWLRTANGELHRIIAGDIALGR